MNKKQADKAKWMTLYEITLLSLGHQPGKVDWNTAEYLYNSGKDSFDAAQITMKTINSK